MFVTGINFYIINKSIPKKNKSYNKYKNYQSINENNADINSKIGKIAKCINEIKKIILHNLYKIFC